MIQLSTINKRQRGAVAVIVAISIVALVGIVGLALDLGKLYVAKSELQNSADACALAAARELTGSSDTQLTIAEAAGKKTGQVNNVLFQSEPVTSISVTFSDVINGTYQAAFEGSSARNMKYARCNTTRTGIANWLVQVLNILPGTTIGPQTVQSTAVAHVVSAQTNCALPIALCQEKINSAGFKVGDWIAGALDPKGANQGSFRWVDIGDTGGGAREIKDILSGSGVCDLPSTGSGINLKPGNNNGANPAWNTRFGMYTGSYSSPVDGVPDFTGFAYTPFSWPTYSNAYSDFKNKRTSFSKYQGDDLTQLETKYNTPLPDLNNGADRRIDLVPVVNCSQFDSNKGSTLINYACVLLLHPIGNKWKSSPSIPGEPAISGNKMYLEYLGMADSLTSPCVSQGIPGGTGGVGPKVPVLVK